MTKTYKIEEYFSVFEQEDSFSITLSKEDFDEYCQIKKDDDSIDFRLIIEDLEGETKTFGDIINKKDLWKYLLIRQLTKEVNIRLFATDDEEKYDLENTGLDGIFMFEAYV